MENNQKEKIKQAIRDIGLALCSVDGCVTTDIPGTPVNDTSWVIDHEKEVKQLDFLEDLFNSDFYVKSI